MTNKVFKKYFKNFITLESDEVRDASDLFDASINEGGICLHGNQVCIWEYTLEQTNLGRREGFQVFNHEGNLLYGWEVCTFPRQEYEGEGGLLNF